MIFLLFDFPAPRVLCVGHIGLLYAGCSLFSWVSVLCSAHGLCWTQKAYGHRLVLLLQDSFTQYVLRFGSTQMRMDAGLVLLLQDSLTVCGALGASQMRIDAGLVLFWLCYYGGCCEHVLCLCAVS